MFMRRFLFISMVSYVFILGCHADSSKGKKMPDTFDPKVTAAIQSIVTSEMSKIGVTSDVFISSIIFYCKKDNVVRQGVLRLNENTSEIESCSFFYSDRVLRSIKKPVDKNAIISKSILDIIHKKELSISDIQDIQIKWSAMKGDRFLRGYISLDDCGNAITNSFGSL